jgi:hypothetical protein
MQMMMGMQLNLLLLLPTLTPAASCQLQCATVLCTAN